MSETDDLPVAGTAVLLRPAPRGIEVLLMRRPDRGSFAGAWVFPGGRVEEVDRLGDADADSADSGRDVHAAADSDSADSDVDADERSAARRAAIRETREEVGLDIADAVVLSLWQPPVQAPVRIRTWFFVAAAPEGALTLSADEVVDAVWITPERALSAHATGEWTLFPPTWVTLHRLTGVPSVEAALAAAGTAQSFATRVRETPSGTVFEWDGLRLETGSLPWSLVAD